MLTNKLPKWVRYRAAAYLRGKGLSMGVPSLIDGPLFPILAHEGQTYEISMGPEPQRHIVGEDLSVFNNDSFDHIVGQNNHNKLPELINKLKLGGHMIIVGDSVIAPPLGMWQIKEQEAIDNVYISVYKKLVGRGNVIYPKKPSSNNTVCIVRYGAIGDALQLTPLIHQLADDGYEVTLNISPYTVDIYRHNPYVKNIIIQERNVIPNHDLGEYWDYWKNNYTRYINLSESIEGKLLKVEGRTEYYTPKEWRHKTCNVNYHDQHMRLGGYNDTKYHLPELYFSRTEEKDLEYELKYLDKKFVIAWALKGSSHHKFYPYYPEVAAEFLDQHDDCYILQMGGPESTGLQITHNQAIPLAGKWPIRKSMLATRYADLVIGPESAIVNAASCFDTPKIVLLSHSTGYNLTHYWRNTVALEPSLDMASCYPCHQLHYTLESCPTIDLEIGDRLIKSIPACTSAIRPEIVYDALEDCYLRWKNNLT